MEMHQIRYFLAACETRNFTRASELCAVSQPALTKAIKLLEEELGGPLFLRDSRPLQLTNLGRLLQERFGRLWGLTNEIKTTARTFLDLQTSNFTLGVVNTLGERRLSEVAASVQRTNPDISLSIRYLCQRTVLGDLQNGVVELAILVDDGRPELSAEISELLVEPYGVAMCPDHPLASRPAVQLAHLHEVDFVNRSHCECTQFFEELFAQRGVSLMVHLVSDQEEVCRRMVAAGLGVSLLPQGLADPMVEFRPLIEPEVHRRIVVAHRSERPLSPIARAIRGAILEADWR